MGCDIHLHAEVRDEDGVWKDETTYETEWIGEYPLQVNTIYDGRHYAIFAILAGVRNYYHGITPISPPRGLPDDVSTIVLAESENWGMDGHSHSYFTLEELEDFDWDQTVSRRAFNYPHCCFGNDSVVRPGENPGGGFYEPFATTILTPEEVLAIAKQRGVDPSAQEWDELPQDLQDALEHVCVHSQWTETYANIAANFVNETIPKLRALGEPKDVRIVFWFDN